MCKKGSDIMQKGLNLQIFEMKEKITKVINESNMPITITQMALFEISAQVNGIAAQTIEAERKAFEEGGKEDGEKIHKDTISK
jgi:hypothetical protein